MEVFQMLLFVFSVFFYSAFILAFVPLFGFVLSVITLFVFFPALKIALRAFEKLLYQTIELALDTSKLFIDKILPVWISNITKAILLAIFCSIYLVLEIVTRLIIELTTKSEEFSVIVKKFKGNFNKWGWGLSIVNTLIHCLNGGYIAFVKGMDFTHQFTVMTIIFGWVFCIIYACFQIREKICFFIKQFLFIFYDCAVALGISFFSHIINIKIIGKKSFLLLDSVNCFIFLLFIFLLSPYYFIAILTLNFCLYFDIEKNRKEILYSINITIAVFLSVIVMFEKISITPYYWVDLALSIVILAQCWQIVTFLRLRPFLEAKQIPTEIRSYDIVNCSEKVSQSIKVNPFLIYSNKNLVPQAGNFGKKKVLFFNENLTKYLDEDEISAIIAHEYGHFLRNIELLYKIQTKFVLMLEFLSQKHDLYAESKRKIIEHQKMKENRQYLNNTMSVYVSKFCQREFYIAEFFADQIAIRYLKKQSIPTEKFVSSLMKVSFIVMISKNRLPFDDHWKEKLSFDSLWNNFTKKSVRKKQHVPAFIEREHYTHPSILSRCKKIDKRFKSETYRIPLENLYNSFETSQHQLNKEITQSLCRSFLDEELFIIGQGVLCPPHQKS